jgi:hypothetical protein
MKFDRYYVFINIFVKIGFTITQAALKSIMDIKPLILCDGPFSFKLLSHFFYYKLKPVYI